MYATAKELIAEIRRAARECPAERERLKQIAITTKQQGLEAGIAAFANWQNAIASGGNARRVSKGGSMQHANYTDINDLLGDLRRALKVHPTEKPTLKAIADLAERDGLEAGIAAFANWQNAIANGGKAESPQPAAPESAQAIENSDRLTALFKQLAEQSHQHLVSDANGTFTLDRPIEEIEAKYAETAHAILRECLERAARFFLEKSTGQVQPEIRQAEPKIKQDEQKDKQEQTVCKHPTVLALLKKLENFVFNTKGQKLSNLPSVKKEPATTPYVMTKTSESELSFEETILEGFSMGPELLCRDSLIGRVLDSFNRAHTYKTLEYIRVLREVPVWVSNEQCKEECAEECDCGWEEFWAVSENAIKIAIEMLSSGADLIAISNAIYLRWEIMKQRCFLRYFGPDVMSIENLRKTMPILSEQEFNQVITYLNKLGLLLVDEKKVIPMVFENEINWEEKD